MEKTDNKKIRPTKAKKIVALEDILFSCRNKLRGNASMEVKRDLLLTLTFIKFIYDRFISQQEKILLELPEDERQDPEIVEDELSTPESYTKDGVFFLRDEYRWDKLKVSESSLLAANLDNAIARLMENEANLRGALPSQIFTNARLEGSVLKAVVDEVDKIDAASFGQTDLIGRVYEYFLQQFSVNADKEEGEFYTPHSIVELLANLIEPFDGTIYDPCCGSGGMFVQSIKIIEAHGGNTRSVSVYGQESDPNTYRLAKMNLAVRGISHHLGGRNASSFSNDLHPDLRANYIMANPPFNKKDWMTTAALRSDRRWKINPTDTDYITPPEGNANYAWILHMLYHLEPRHGVAGFLLSNGALDDSDTLAIRRRLIESDKIEAIFILPREMFYSTDTSVTLWLLNQNKRGGLWHGRRQRRRSGEILFVDLRTWTDNQSTLKTDKSRKTFNVFSPEQIRRIVEIYHRWQAEGTDGAAYAQPELYRAVSLPELAANNYSLVPSRYIEFVDRREELEIKPAMKLLDNTYAELLSKAQALKETISHTSHLSKYFSTLKAYFPLTPIGSSIDEEPLIELYDERNVDGKIKVFKGIDKSKEFVETKADTENVDATKYKIVHSGCFAFSGMQTGRDKCIRIALNKTDEDIIISPAYFTFKLNEKHLLPEYLMMQFKRSETDRLGWFYSDSSVRANLDWDRLMSFRIPLPPIDVQRSIVAIYQCAQKAKQIAEEADRLSKEVCPALIQHMIHEYDK